jgi:hypothetical protein
MRWPTGLVPAALFLLVGCGDSGIESGPIVGPTVAEVADVIVSPAHFTVSVGAAVRLRATPLDRDGKEMTSVTVTWSSSDPEVAYVLSNAGIVTGVRPGTASVTASSGDVSGAASVIVEPSGVVVIHGLEWTFDRVGGDLAPLSGVWGSAENDVFAVGTTTLWDCCATIMHYDGKAWSHVTIPRWGELRDVWGSSGSDVFAVGESGTIVHYDGTQWTLMPRTTDHAINAVWGSSGHDVFAVGDDNVILHYDGNSWSRMLSPANLNGGSLSDVWGSSPTDVFAVGGLGTILHFDGIGWTGMSSPTTRPLFGVWGSSGTSVFAVGVAGIILHYDGTDWNPMPSPTAQLLLAIWGNSESDVFVVGTKTPDYPDCCAIILHYDGTIWRGVEGPTGQALFDVWGVAGQTFVVGSGPTILHGTR